MDMAIYSMKVIYEHLYFIVLMIIVIYLFYFIDNNVIAILYFQINIIYLWYIGV